jgi:hypothetical protein
MKCEYCPKKADFVVAPLDHRDRWVVCAQCLIRLIKDSILLAIKMSRKVNEN